MQLNILERMMATSSLLALKEGNFITFKIINSVKDKLFIGEEESNAVNMRIEDDKYLWDSAKDIPKDFEFTDAEFKLIKEQLEIMDREKKLTPNHLSLYSKFFPE